MTADLAGKLAEKEFSENLIRCSAVPTFVIDAGHRVLIWNGACEELTGVSERDMLGTCGQWRPFYGQERSVLADMVVDGKMQDISSHYAVCRRSSLIVDGLQAEGWYPALGGKARYVVFDAAPIHGSDGRVIAAIETLQDITERKLAERQLQMSRAELLVKHEELKSLFLTVERVKKEWEMTMDCLGDIIIVTDNTGRIKRCNRALKELMAMPYVDIIGTNWAALLSVPEPATMQAYARPVDFFHPPSKRWFEVNVYPFNGAHDEDLFGTVITLHDLTETRRMNLELEKACAELKATQSQMLQTEKMASIGQLAAGVAHEVNNPIGFIASNLATLGKYVERLREFIAIQAGLFDAAGDMAARPELAEARRKLKLDYIMEDAGQLIAESLDGADRVRKIVQDLKSFSRVDEAECKEANLVECLETTINIVWNELKYKVALKREYGEIPFTMCHPQQLNQVFMNLLVNAAQAIESRGEITVSCRHDNGAIFVTIADTGCGIPQEHLRRVFEPFFTTKEVGQGTGLGLSISYDIIKNHNGEITVRSEVGRGTTFTVTIPVVERR